MSSDFSGEMMGGSGFVRPQGLAPPTVFDVEASHVYATMIDGLRDFLDGLASARPDKETLVALNKDLQCWSEKLATFEVDEYDRLFGRQREIPGSGQSMVPKLTITGADDQSMRGTVRFGDYFLGANGAAHGGAIPLLLDDLIGRLANTGGRSIARTVSLRTEYRSITPIGPELDVSAWFVSEQGRKRVLHAEIRHGEKLCAEAECLLITLKPGQQ